MWSGSIATIPSGWSLCDGTSPTPNLQNMFIVGAGDTYAVDATGGSADAVVVSHNHTWSGNINPSSHNHGYTGREGNAYPDGSGDDTQPGGSNSYPRVTQQKSVSLGVNGSVASTGASGTNKNLPPYYSLAYIMYVGA
jgi:microcystin-dependent protein